MYASRLRPSLIFPISEKTSARLRQDLHDFCNRIDTIAFTQTGVRGKLSLYRLTSIHLLAFVTFENQKTVPVHSKTKWLLLLGLAEQRFKLTLYLYLFYRLSLIISKMHVYLHVRMRHLLDQILQYKEITPSGIFYWQNTWLINPLTTRLLNWDF